MSADSTTRLLPVEDYLESVMHHIEPMPPFEHPLMDAIGLPVAEDVHAPVSLPVFDNSGMDGYAVAFRDVADATADRPVHLPVVGEIAAGQTTIFTLTPGTAVRIMTGAPVPEGCTAVVPFEWTEETERGPSRWISTVGCGSYCTTHAVVGSRSRTEAGRSAGRRPARV